VSDEDCKLSDKLSLIHKWAHICFDDLTKEDLEAAHKLGHAILDLLNDREGADKPDGVKFLALFEIISIGVDVMEDQLRSKTQWGMKSKGIN
jgi:uncharacterized protein